MPKHLRDGFMYTPKNETVWKLFDKCLQANPQVVGQLHLLVAAAITTGVKNPVLDLQLDHVVRYLQDGFGNF